MEGAFDESSLASISLRLSIDPVDFRCIVRRGDLLVGFVGAVFSAFSINWPSSCIVSTGSIGDDSDIEAFGVESDDIDDVRPSAALFERTAFDASLPVVESGASSKVS
jgi:hypothetical protein